MESKPSRINIIQARYVLGRIPNSELPKLATQLLIDGYDSLALRILAGLQAYEIDLQANTLWEQIKTDLALTPMTSRDAARIYAIDALQQVILGTIDPFIAAEELWDVSIEAKSSDKTSNTQNSLQSEFHDLDPFVYCASEAHSRPGDREFFRQAILSEARDWLDQRGTDNADLDSF
ncbi:hypothetical protein ACP8Y2_10770 [Herpetosiphon llansteffanensis]